MSEWIVGKGEQDKGLFSIAESALSLPDMQT